MTLRKSAQRVLERTGLRREVSDEIPKSYLASLLPADAVIVEAGAHIGEDTVGLCEHFPGGTVHAFEPIDRLREQVVARVTGHSNVVVYPQALGGRTGTAAMWVSGGGGDQSSSLREPKTHLTELPEVTFQEQTTVQVTTLDDWAEEHGIEKVDLLWLDLQGAEADALRAAPRVLARAEVLHLEVMGTEQYEGAMLWPELRAWLESQGFTVARENRPWPNGGGNMVFVRR